MNCNDNDTELIRKSTFLPHFKYTEMSEVNMNMVVINKGSCLGNKQSQVAVAQGKCSHQTATT